MGSKKKELTAADFTVTVPDNDKAVVRLGDAELVTTRAGLTQMIKRLCAVAAEIR